MDKLTSAEARRARLIPVICVCIGQIIWGFSYLFTRVAQRAASPSIVLSMRFLFAGLILTGAILTGRARFSIKGKNWKNILFIALLEPPYYFFESYGIYYSNVTFAGTVMAFSPVIGMFAAMLFLGEHPSRRQLAFCALPTIGVIMMTISGNSIGVVKPAAIFFLFASQITSAATKLYNKKASSEFSSFERSYVIITSNAVIFTLQSLFTLRFDIKAYLAPLSDTTFLLALLMLCVLCSIAANLLVNYACEKMSMTNLSTFSTIATICSAFSGALFLHEPVTLATLTGSLLIIVGIWQVTH